VIQRQWNIQGVAELNYMAYENEAIEKWSQLERCVGMADEGVGEAEFMCQGIRSLECRAMC
jgi:hypothetical protein